KPPHSAVPRLFSVAAHWKRSAEIVQRRGPLERNALAWRHGKALAIETDSAGERRVVSEFLLLLEEFACLAKQEARSLLRDFCAARAGGMLCPIFARSKAANRRLLPGSPLLREGRGDARLQGTGSS